MKQLEVERRAATATAAFPSAPKVKLLVALAGVGEIGATVLVTRSSTAASKIGGISPPISD